MVRFFFIKLWPIAMLFLMALCFTACDGQKQKIELLSPIPEPGTVTSPTMPTNTTSSLQMSTTTSTQLTSETVMTQEEISKEISKIFPDKQSQPPTQRTPRQEPYTTRPLLAVGDFVSYDSQTSAVTVKINRELSKMPRKMELDAIRMKQLDELLDREFPIERTFILARYTSIHDARIDPNAPPPTRNKPRPVTKLSMTDFIPGDRVSISFRMSLKDSPTSQPIALNFCKVDSDRTEFRADMGPPKRVVKRPEVTDHITSITTLTQERFLNRPITQKPLRPLVNEENAVSVDADSERITTSKASLN